MRIVKKLYPYFKILRIKNWLAHFLIGFFGFVISGGFSASFWHVFLFWAVFFFFLGFLFSINDCFDTAEDRYNKNSKKLVVGKEISFRNSLYFSISLGLLGLLFSVFLGLKVFLFSVVLFFISFFYSVPPIRLKSRPLLDLISHGLFGGALNFLLPLVVFENQINQFHYWLVSTFFYFSIILELRNHLDDYEADKKAGLRTSVCVFGYKNSERLLRYLAIFFPFSVLPAYLFFFPQYIFIYFLFTFLFLVLFLRHENYESVKQYHILDVYFIFSLFLFL